MLSKHLTGRFRAAFAGGVTGDKADDDHDAELAHQAAIERLEQIIAEKEARIAALQDELEQEQYKTGILEQSYATQLEEARERADAAEQALSDQQSQIAEFEADRTKLTSELDSARARLEMISPDDGLSVDELLASFSAPRERPVTRDADGRVDAPVDPQTLEEMLPADVMFTRKR